MKRKTYRATGLPYEKINRALNLQIEYTEVTVHSVIWRKISKKHPESLSAVSVHLNDAIMNPDFVGQAHTHHYNIEMIKRTPAGPLLVAIKIRDSRAFYCEPLVASAYLIDTSDIHARLKKGTIKRFK